MKNIELLAPAGSIESLVAAINAGADAIYVGGMAFGARKSAGFDNDQLKQAVEICHKNGVSLYVTVNTLIKEDELLECIQFIDFLYQIRVDALILQDIGLLSAVKVRYPDFECHASTQMTLHSSSDVIYAAEMGFSRVVVARELTFEEISEIRSVTDIELEVFIHGALCISYSGNCLMSSMIGNRSGNRGSCAQPCRKKYTLKDHKTGEILSERNQVYLLSPKDLSVIDQMNHFKTFKNVSLKIEGRLKGPDYVYNVVSHYRNAIDGNLTTSTDLVKSFNRQFTGGHLFKEAYSELMNYEIPSGYGTILGKVKHYENQIAEIMLFDTLNKGDEIQNRINGNTTGARADVIYRGGEKIDSADKGDVIKLAYKMPLKKNAILYKTYDKVFIDEMTRLGKIQYPKFGVRFKFKAFKGQSAILEAYCSETSDPNFWGQCVALESVHVFSNRQVEEARSIALDEIRITEQLSKLGGTPFFLEDLSLEIDENIALPISELNRMRRDVIALIEAQFLNRYPSRTERMDKISGQLEELLDIRTLKADPRKRLEKDCDTFRFHVMNKEQLALLIQFKKSYEHEELIEIIYHDLKHFNSNFEHCLEEQIIPAMPKIIRNAEISWIESFLARYFSDSSSRGVNKSISIAHVAHQALLKPYKNADVRVEEDAMLFNSMSIRALESRNVSFSHEVTLHEAKKAMSHIVSNSKDYQWFVYGRFPVMTSEYCVVGGVLEGHDHCGRCLKQSFVLEDEMKVLYPLVLDSAVCRMAVLLPKPIYLLDELEVLNQTGVKCYKISFLGASEEEIKAILREIELKRFLYKKEDYTRGHYKKEIE